MKGVNRVRPSPPASRLWDGTKSTGALFPATIPVPIPPHLVKSAAPVLGNGRDPMACQ